MPRDCPVDVAVLEEIAAKHGTPFQLYDEAGIRDNIRGLLSSFGGSFPGFVQFFAVKALPNPAILKLLVNEGCGLDCSSASELYIAKQLGLPGERVMYTSNYTSQEDLGTAFDQGVIINLDDISLVDSLVAARGRCPDLISFRLNPGLGRTDSETVSNVLGGPDAKFGVPPFQIVEAYRKARDAGAKRFGIHMMTGSCVLNNDYWVETVTRLFDTIAEIKAKLDINFEMVNIGGGLGVTYKPDQPVVDVPALVKILRGVVDAKVAEHKIQEPILCMENGRYVTGPHGYLVSRCHAIKDTYAKYYGLDACMSNLMRPGMYGSYHYISVPKHDGGKVAPPKDDWKPANVVGTLCENNDWFCKDRLLPPATAIGDLFVIHDSGAHAHSMGFQYNGKLRAPELLLRPDGQVAVIRDRETIARLYENTHIPDGI